MAGVDRISLRRFVFLIVASLLSFVLSGIAGLLGLGPENVVRRLLGDTLIVFILDHYPNLFTSASTRWAFLFISIDFFMLAFLLIFGIPLYRTKKDLNKLQKENEKSNEQMAMLRKELAQVKTIAAKKERSIRRLHNRTREMLQEIRKRKMGASNGK